jgi:hypothetical protein
VPSFLRILVSVDHHVWVSEYLNRKNMDHNEEQKVKWWWWCYIFGCHNVIYLIICNHIKFIHFLEALKLFCAFPLCPKDILIFTIKEFTKVRLQCTELQILFTFCMAITFIYTNIPRRTITYTYIRVQSVQRIMNPAHICNINSCIYVRPYLN